MADYVLPSVVEKRVRYFDGQFLQDQDFIDEQDYQLDREHRHNRLLHGPGITEGLLVTSSGPNQVTVSAGSAIDSDGRPLVLAQATTVDLPAADFNDKQGIQLLISYLESAEDPQTVGGSQDFTRWLERPGLTALAPGETYSGSYPTVLLMTLSLDGSGRVTGDNSPRGYSGLLMPGLGADAATLSAGSGGTAQLAGTLSVTGSVGIGLTPGFPLHLAQGKALRIEAGTSATDTAAYFSFGGDGTFNIDARNQAGGRLTVQNSGDVGIGTATPGAKLEVVGSGGTNVDLQVNGRLRSNSNDGGLWVSTDRFIGGDGGKNVGFYAGGAWRLLVAPSGNIGIGTSNPLLPLHFAPGLGLRIEAGTSATDTASYFSFGGTGTFNIDAPGVGGGRFTVQTSGRVGIGTGSPGSRLHVSLPSTSSPVNAMQIDVASFGTTGNAAASNFLLIRDVGAGGDPYVTIRGDGGAYFRGSLNYWWGPDNAWKNIQNRASDYAGSYSTGGPSDIRLKDDVRPIGPALDLVRQLQGVRYRWSETGLAHFTRDIETSVSAGPDATPEQHEKVWRAERDRALDRLAGDRLGLIAQDVELVIPELVHEGDDGYKRIRYQHLTALLAEAIKEQDAAVRALSSEVAALRSTLSAQAN
jgi:hypothetical protein